MIISEPFLDWFDISMGLCKRFFSDNHVLYGAVVLATWFGREQLA